MKGGKHMELTYNDIYLNCENCQLTNIFNKKLLYVTDNERKILKLLLQHGVITVNKIEELTGLNSNVIPVHISNIRNKLKTLDIETKIIGMRKVGYRLEYNN